MKNTMKTIFMICLLSNLSAVSINAMESRDTNSTKDQTEIHALMQARISDLERRRQTLLKENKEYKKELKSEQARLQILPNDIFVFGAKDGNNIVKLSALIKK
jgi:hypothetical protein